MEKNGDQNFCALIHALKLALAEKNRFKRIDYTIITL